LFFLLIRLLPRSTLFPYTTLFRSVRLELRMYVGAEDVAADRVIVRGVPDLELEIKGGVHGDRATAAMVVNAIPRVISARPGVLRSEEHTSELQSRGHLVCRLLLEK